VAYKLASYELNKNLVSNIRKYQDGQTIWRTANKI
jgi:hypothetical protein